jgi:hypothetical protein
MCGHKRPWPEEYFASGKNSMAPAENYGNAYFGNYSSKNFLH